MYKLFLTLKLEQQWQSNVHIFLEYAQEILNL